MTESKTAEPRLCITLEQWIELCMERKKHPGTDKADDFIIDVAERTYPVVEHLSYEIVKNFMRRAFELKNSLYPGSLKGALISWLYDNGIPEVKLINRGI
jgi:hypothetical protein